MNFTGNNWSDPSSGDRIEIVFSNRKKEFGAYVLRKKYPETLFTSLFIATCLILVFIVIEIFLDSSFKKKDSPPVSTEIILAEPPSIDKSIPPPPAVAIPPTVQRTIKFSLPVIVRDEIVEDLPPSVDELQTAQASTVTTDANFTETLPQDDPIVETPESDQIFTFVEEMPSFPGGESEMISFILANIRYPEVARENNVYGKVYVKFMIDKEGKVVKPEILRGIGGGCDEEAIRILKMMPDWKPGRQNGKKVKVGGMVLHVDFVLR